MLTRDEAWAMLESAERVYDAPEVDRAIERLAAQLSEHYRDRYPLLLCVMNGALFFCGKLLPLLRFPLHLDYVHATRYGDELDGREVRWKVEPTSRVAGRDVIVLDDILDEGATLAAIRARVLDLGAQSCRVAVLTEKDTGKPKPVRADYVGLTVPNRFVFGCGLDAHGCWRNLDSLYALKESN